MSWVEAALRWYGVLLALTWALAPAARWLCLVLADRGATVARPIAVLMAVFPAWLLASLGLVPFSAAAITLTVIGGGIVGWALLLRRVGLDRSWLRALLLTEAAASCLFAAYVWLRGFTPQILGTEKPMDIAFLASSSRAIVIPPPDPWFAGEPINYYYLGYLLHGTLGRLAGVAPEMAFNLALATIFSSTAAAAFGIAWNVVCPRFGSRAGAASGFSAAFTVAIAGNLYAPWRLLRDPAETIAAWWWDSGSGVGWRSSRIVCDGPRSGNLCPAPSVETINEFPFFSFLLGDLHPHLMALPYTIVAIALAWNLALSGAGSMGTNRSMLARVALSGALFGALYALNAWDYPTYLLLAGVAVWTGAAFSLRAAWKAIALLIAASLLPWLPYIVTYVPPTLDAAGDLPSVLSRLPLLPNLLSAFALHAGERTSVVEYLTMFGVPYLLALVFVIAGAGANWGDARQRASGALTIAAATLIPGVLLSAPVIALCGVPLVLAVQQIRAAGRVTPRVFALLLLALAWTLSIGVEIVYIRDAFGNRMNTMFKFYYQIWTLYAVAASVALVILWDTAARTWQRAALATATTAALLAGIAYPVVASYQWTDHFAAWRGLDGLAYGETANSDDVAAIRWLWQHAAPGDVMLEAAGCSYRPFDRLPFNRVSAFSGVPTVIGWGDNHQRQWRAGQPDLISRIDGRQADVAALFADPAGPLLDRYGIRWLFVGEYETGDWRAECRTAGPYAGPSGDDFPGSGWEEAFRAGDTRIYRRLNG